MATRLLVVEDDDRIRSVLRLALEDEGYQVSEATSGEAALRQFRTKPVDMMIVDLMLGEVDGFTCIRDIRKVSDIPIIIISARADTHDIVAGLEAGADDYVTKPFQIKEVTARLRALRRRARTPGDPEVPPDIVLDSTRQLVLSPSRGTLLRDGQDVHLTLTEFRLLSELANPPGRVQSRRALLESVWEHGFFGDERIVDVHIRRLRTKIEQDPGAPRLIVTVRGLGYRLDPQ
ncbi:response regulator transcription factor [Thermasporomyces composti]|jgi:DNA-binding response OmpR family regulator|uniref:DNA-binding response OmpR family regulator n=1 Tax=Thermasporomyces composti TaxID=696763 RepID=A0A3D9V9J2_THECX|nr:response regulator transcription factor [Thermasporomyces composti]REF35665.1 DNA-binding response OmpR family regulator [Thermasporomyces composti]